jgi:hypothetical protein
VLLAIIAAGAAFVLITIDLLTRRVLLLQAGPALVGMPTVASTCLVETAWKPNRQALPPYAKSCATWND